MWRLIIALVLPLFCFSQSRISGKVTDEFGALEGASVVLKDSISTIIDYTYTNKEGAFNLKTDQTGEFNIEFSALGYLSQTAKTYLKKNEKITLDIELEQELVELDEIIAKGRKSITQKKDTIVFDVQSFADGNEEVLEDLLKNIPGLVVEEDGTIKVGNKQIEKIMIEGDDFFERGYKILSKNMPTHPIEQVEILLNYSNNRLLKGIEDSERVALNLKLDEKSKRIWFGNITLGYDALSDEDRYFMKGNLMNFGKKNKYYFLTNLNNIGYDATGDINHLIRPARGNEPAGIGDNENISTLINLSTNVPNFEKSRTNFNNAEVVSLNAIFNPSEKLKIKTLGFLNWGELSFYRNRIDNVSVSDLNFTNTEDFQLKKDNRVTFGQLHLNYDISKNQLLESTTKYQNAEFLSNSDLIFNQVTTMESLKTPVTFFDQKISYTNKISDKKVLLVSSRFINEKSPQKYHINQFLYQDLFPNTNANSVRQTLSQKMTFAGFEAHLLDRKKSKNLFEFKIGNACRKDILNSKFTLLENQNLIDNPIGYQNNLTYEVNDIYAKAKYQFNLGSFYITGNFEAHQLINSLDQNNITTTQQPFFLNSKIGIDWDINHKNKIRTSYENNTTNADVLNVYDGYILTDFRRFSKGVGDFNQIEASSLFVNYQYGNWSDLFFSNTTISYTKHHDFFSTNSQISQNFSQSESIVIHDRELFAANTSLDYFIKKYNSNLKIKLGYVKSQFKNIINNSDLRSVNSTNYNYGIEYKSLFDGVFNLNIGTHWRISKIESTTTNKFTNNQSYIDFNFDLSDKLNLIIKNERYSFENTSNNEAYYFVDLSGRYTLKKNKLTLMLSGKNLLNTENYQDIAISDIGTTITSYRLLPRYLLLKIEYRF